MSSSALSTRLERNAVSLWAIFPFEKGIESSYTESKERGRSGFYPGARARERGVRWEPVDSFWVCL